MGPLGNLKSVIIKYTYFTSPYIKQLLRTCLAL